MSGVICSRTQTFLASSIILPHKPKSKNQPLFSNSTKLNCSNAAVTLLSAHKANPVAYSTFWFNFRHARISSDCSMLLRQPLDRTLHTEKYAPCKPVMLVRIQNPLQQETKSCKQSTSVSRMRRHLSEPYQQTCILDFSEVLIQQLNHQIIPLFSVQELEVKICSHCCATVSWHNIAVYDLPPDFSFSFVIVLVLVRFACCNFYFYIVFVFQIAIVFVFVTKIALPPTGEFMVLLQGGVTLFQGGGEFSTPTGWLDKPLYVYRIIDD